MPTLTKEQLEEFERATQPLRDWLKLNTSPNIVAVVNGNQAGLFEGIAQVNDELKPS